ncbi:MAG: hypothetical protein BroJett014_04580 [Planctomycetota bacterium]|nr:MAG: hypothetical protein BroJett014_04580 [Planctomycetota bacterium]
MVLNAVRFATLHNGAAQATKWYKPDGLWPAIETALDLGESPSIVADFLQALAPDYEKWGPEHFYRPLEPGRKDLLKSREAIVSALIDGRLAANRVAEGWKRVLRFHPCELPEIRLVSEEQLQLITQIAMSVASSNEQFLGHDSPNSFERAIFSNPEVGKWPHMDSWGEVLSKEWLRLHTQCELSMPATSMESPLYRLANNPWMWKGARRALSAFSAEHGMTNSLVSQMLAESDPESGFVTVAAARLLFPDQPPNRRAASDVELGEIEQLFSRVVSFRWPEGRIGGVEPKKLFTGINKIQLIRKLEGEFKVMRKNGMLLVDQQYVADMIGRGGLTKRTRALALLYFLHELVHELQGVGDIAAVRNLRSTGGETTLLHLDLAADHAAIFLAAHAFPEFEAMELRDIQSSSLSGFPVSRYHGAASRARKAGRAVSCRVDYLARKHALVAPAEIGDEYFFAEFGPNGGKLLVFLSGPSMRLIKSGPLTPEDANVMSSCLDGGVNSKKATQKLDASLTQLLGLATQGPRHS